MWNVKAVFLLVVYRNSQAHSGWLTGMSQAWFGCTMSYEDQRLCSVWESSHDEFFKFVLTVATYNYLFLLPSSTIVRMLFRVNSMEKKKLNPAGTWSSSVSQNSIFIVIDFHCPGLHWARPVAGRDSVFIYYTSRLLLVIPLKSHQASFAPSLEACPILY